MCVETLTQRTVPARDASDAYVGSQTQNDTDFERTVPTGPLHGTVQNAVVVCAFGAVRKDVC